MRVRFPAVLLLLCAGCGSARNWCEVPVHSLSFAEVYDGIEMVSRDGFVPEPEQCDRGLGVYQSRWHESGQSLGLRPIRVRLRAEIMEGGSREKGWVVRYCVEQQKVKDMGKFTELSEKDWSNAGQDPEREANIGNRLRRYYATRQGDVDQAPGGA
jgi:hypothetical protein